MTPPHYTGCCPAVCTLCGLTWLRVWVVVLQRCGWRRLPRVGQTTLGGRGRSVLSTTRPSIAHGRRRRVRERLTGPHFLGSVLVFRTGYPVNRLTVNIPTGNVVYYSFLRCTLLRDRSRYLEKYAKI